MKTLFDSALLPNGGVFLLCSSHEERCLGIVADVEHWAPYRAVVFRYDDDDERGRKHHATIVSALERCCPVEELPLAGLEGGGVAGSQARLQSVLLDRCDCPIVLDMSVLSKRHLLLLLRCIDDCGLWGHLWIVYSEPEDYEIEGRLPLSFGLSSVNLLPGFDPSANPSRPLHAAIFLGYEGDRAFSTYDIIQPKKTTLIIPFPPFREDWIGRTEERNQSILATIDDQSSVESADALDPRSTVDVLGRVFGDIDSYSDFSRTVCPLGTKPQALGAYMYIRECKDPPSVIYSQVLRHNVDYYSRGIGERWLVCQPE